MEGFVYIALFLFSIAFAIVVAYLSFVLHRVNTMLNSLDKTIDDVEKEVTGLMPQLRQTIQESDRMADDIGVKVKSTDNLFATAENVGDTVNASRDIISNSTTDLSDAEIQKKTKPLAEGIKWSEVVLSLYSKWKKIKKHKRKEE